MADLRRPAVVLSLLILAAATAGAVDVVHVPDDAPDLPSAVAAVPDGGVVELAGGVYGAPPGGFRFDHLAKSITIRSEADGEAILDGGGAEPVFRLYVQPNSGAQVVLERLRFRNGVSSQNGVGGGVTITSSEAVFVDCVFEANGSDAIDTGGGGTFIWGGSKVLLVGCTWLGNWADVSGAGLRIDESEVSVHRGRFVSNRTNLAGHRTSSAGGGIHLTNGVLTVTNSRFEANEAGYVGGGLYALGSWDHATGAQLVVANSTFVGNAAESAPGVTPPGPTEGGGLHVEDHATARITTSRFVDNSAGNGGGLNLYRAEVTVEDTVFTGNRATAGDGVRAFGGAISAISNDTAVDGDVNRPVARLVVRRSLLRGATAGDPAVAEIGGGVFASGDLNRQFGGNGVPQIGTAADNRALLLVADSAVVDCDVAEEPGLVGTGAGGGIHGGLADMTVSGSVVVDSDALGDGSAGGGLRAIIDSTAQLTGVTVANNSAELFGGGLFAQGAHLDVTGCDVVENGVGSGGLYGAAMFTAPDEAQGLDVTGLVSGSVLSNPSDRGRLIFDDDRQGSPTVPINRVRYDDNTIFDTTWASEPYWNAITWAATVDELNDLVVNRSGGAPSTEKSLVDNDEPASAPVVGELLAVPPITVPVTAVGDQDPATPSFLVWVASGAQAVLDDIPLTELTGIAYAAAGPHVLEVGGEQISATVATVAAPASSFTASPIAISSGDTAILSWAVTAGSFVDLVLDHGLDPAAAPSGSIDVSPDVTTTYRLVVVTEQGGVAAEVTVWVDEAPPSEVFSDGFESGTTGEWSSAVP